MARRVLLVAALLAIWCLCGCAIMKQGQELTRQSISALKPRGGDYRNAAEDESDEWEYVGQEARGHMEPLHDPDTLWRQYIMSERARSIERNLGIE